MSASDLSDAGTTNAEESASGFGKELAELVRASGVPADPDYLLPPHVVFSRGLITWTSGTKKIWPIEMKPSVLAERVGVFPGTVAAAPFLELTGLENGNVRVRARKFHQKVYQDVVNAEFLPDCATVAPGAPARLDPLVSRPELGSRTLVSKSPRPHLVLLTVNYIREEILTSLRYLAGSDSGPPGDYSDYVLKPLFDPENID